jgi:N-acetylglucosaminyldiphosphoundecaprenol N-acetyl-beta-D-mannosaminyltransferase
MPELKPDTEIEVRKVDVAGLMIDAITKQELLSQIASRIAKRQKTFVTTPYSEFLYTSLRRPEIRALLNSADFAVADGIGILWAQLFLSLPLTATNFYISIMQAWWQVLWTGVSILISPKNLYKTIPEKIVGADLIWDLAKLALEKNYSIFLLGGRGDVAQISANKLKEKYPGMKVVGTSNKDFNDSSIIEDINRAKPDMLLVAFNPLTQEKWIADNLSKVTASMAIGLGGTFDYIAGAKMKPPKFIRRIGLEWLYRLITQPSRVARIYRGVVGLIVGLVRHKVYSYTTFRSNGVAVVINQQGKILICKRFPGPEKAYPEKDFENYWQFPQGGIDKGEDPITGAQRELFEETGIKNAEVIGQAKYINEYLWNNAARPLMISKYAHKGQSQFTVFFKFTGDDSEIKLDGKEFVDYQWANPKEALEILAPERRPHAEAVLAELLKIQV